MFTKYARQISQRLPSFLYKTLAQAYIDKEFPRHVFIEVTASCNLACSYCPREHISQHIDFNLFKQIVDECSQYGSRSFSLHLFGEPLLYPRIHEAIRYIKQKNKRHTVLLTTNGTRLNEHARGLVASGVDRIIWSWRKNNFDDTTIEILKKHGLIRLLVEETPKEEFERWSKFPRVEVKTLHNYGGKIDLTKWKTNGLRSPDGQRKRRMDEMVHADSRYPCYHLWLAPAVRHDGKILICCADPHGETSLGLYGETTLGEVWRGETLKRLRGEHLKGTYSGLCKGCNVWSTYPSMFWGHQCK